MFSTAAPIRVLAFVWHWGWEKTEQDAVRPTQSKAANQKVDARAKRSARNMPWHSYEWWEDHHYERR